MYDGKCFLDFERNYNCYHHGDIIVFISLLYWRYRRNYTFTVL